MRAVLNHLVVVFAPPSAASPESTYQARRSPERLVPRRADMGIAHCGRGARGEFRACVFGEMVGAARLVFLLYVCLPLNF